jgi:hypothetical protein
MEGFHMVRFFNDDRTTLLYTVYVADGSSAIYAGDTPISTEDNSYIFRGFEPAAVNVSEDMDCYAVYESAIGTLDETSWAKISALSAHGTAQNYFAVGDTKMIHIEGTVGTITLNRDYGVYIIGFNHNSEIEGNGIHFGTFKSAVSNGIDLCLVSSQYDVSSEDGTKCFTMNHWGNANYGGWAGCDMRYDILGSTDKAPSGYEAKVTSSRVGYDPSATCATNPVAGTLMAALPADLRAVMKPMTVYSDNKGGGSNVASYVTATVDYLPLLAEFEIFGKRTRANSEEQKHQTQYAYYAAGNSKVKYRHSTTNTKTYWWERSAYSDSSSCFCRVSPDSAPEAADTRFTHAVAPIFKV